MFCAVLRPRYQVSVYRTICPMVLNNRTKTCTISRLIKEIQLLAGNLGTDFAMLCTIYYLLYGSEIFSDFLFIQEVTVLLKTFKNH